MSAPQLDPDLLKPSLSAHDDVIGFDRPWNPQTIVLWTFFCGMVCGGILYGFNSRRLGCPQRCWPTILGAIAFTFALQLLIFWGLEHGWLDGMSQSTLRYVQQGVAVVAALAMTASQKQRFRLAVISDIPTGSLWIPGFLSAIVGVSIHFALAFVAYKLFQLDLAR